MIAVHKTVLLTAFLFLTFALPLSHDALGAEDFEAFGDRKASEILPAELRSGPYHRVKERVVSYGYQHFYRVESDFGEFQAQGDAMLRRLVREIYAIAALTEISRGEVFLDATKEAVSRPVEGVWNLITDPVDTVSGVPEGMYSIFNRVDEFFDTGRSDYEDGAVKALLAVSSFKRDFAAAQNVDVYSSNSVLQEELNRIGWASAAGNLTLSAATAPFSGPAALAVGQARNVQVLNNVLQEVPAQELNIRNREKLMEMGLDEDLVDRFMEQKIFSPRHKTVFVESLHEMAGAKGKETLVEYAATVEAEAAALFFQQIAEIMAGYHRSVSPAVEIGVHKGIPMLYAENRSAVVAFPADYARWTSRSAPLVEEFSNTFLKSGRADKLEIWITGTFSAKAQKEYAAAGLTLVDNVDQKIGMMD